MKQIESDKKFRVYSSFSLSADDISSLSLLYAPLIKSDAFTIYMGFYSLLERNNQRSEELTHQAFFDIYAIKPTEFYKARIKLEGIGLLNSYQSEDGDYIYVLNAPLSPKNFIKDAQLGLYLYSNAGEEIFEFIRNHFKIEKPETKNYTDVSKSYSDVFTSAVNNDQTFKKFDYLLGKNPTPSIKITDAKFDFDKFIKNINTDLLESGVTSTFKSQIINMSFTYNFNEAELSSLFSDSISKRGVFEYKLLKKEANKLWVTKHNVNAPILIAKDLGAPISSDDALIEFLDNAKPEELLDGVLKEIDAKDIERINDVYTEILLPRGVLNAMILKVAKDKGGEIPTLKYFEKVSESWIKDKILTTADAIKYITTSDFVSQKEKEDIPENGGFEEF